MLFVIKALANQGGGAEKVLVQVASGLAARGHDVVVVTSDCSLSDPYYQMDDRVGLLRLGIGNTKRSASIFDTLRRMHRYRKLVMASPPDVVIAFMHSTFVPVSIALFGSRVPVVASEHCGPAHYSERPLQQLLLQAVPLLSKRITVVSTQIYDSFCTWMRRSMVVMPNPVVVKQSSIAPSHRCGTPRILLSVGRLDEKKDHRTLIDAFAHIASKHPDWILRILGEGDLREVLERQIHGYGLDQKIQMPGAVSAIDTEYQAADLFVLSSSYESFGLATAEALLHRLPAIGFADCPGTNELIIDGVNGCLVRGPDRVKALSDVLDDLMSNTDKRERFANAPIDRLLERFGLEGVLDRWEDLLIDVVDGGAIKAPATRGDSKRDVG